VETKEFISPFRSNSAMVALMKMPGNFETKEDERRVFPRKEIHARVEGKRVDHTVQAYRDPHLALALRDLSLGGLSAISQTPLAAGERLTVFFPPQGPMRGWDAFGRVLRCEPSGLGYRVAVEFDPLPAA
jgi:PilZ domain